MVKYRLKESPTTGGAPEPLPGQSCTNGGAMTTVQLPLTLCS